MPSGKRFFSNLFLILIAISFYLIFSHLPAVRQWLSGVTGVLSPFFAALCLAYVLNRPTCFFERTIFARFPGPRIFAIGLTYLCAAAVVGFLVVLVLPQVVQSIMGLTSNVQTYLTNLSTLVMDLMVRFDIDSSILEDAFLSYQDIVKSVTNYLTASLPRLFGYGMAIGQLLVSCLTALIASMYMLAGKERLLTQARKVLYATLSQERASWLIATCGRANTIFSGFIIGKLLDSAIIGVLCFILCWIFKIPLALLISVIVGFTNVIPFFGPFIGAIPSIMILLLVDPLAALRFSILILALQQFDGNILGPRILGDSTGLSAIWVLVSIVVGGGLFGFIGMLLGVPTFAVLFALTREWTNSRLKEKGVPGELVYSQSTETPPKE